MAQSSTDLQRFMALYESIGVKCLIGPDDDSGGFVIKLAQLSDEAYFRGEPVTMHESFSGFSAFYTTIKFDGEGKYIGQGFWE